MVGRLRKAAQTGRTAFSTLPPNLDAMAPPGSDNSTSLHQVKIQRTCYSTLTCRHVPYGRKCSLHQHACEHIPSTVIKDDDRHHHLSECYMDLNAFRAEASRGPVPA